MYALAYSILETYTRQICGVLYIHTTQNSDCSLHQSM
uniref:Uncharacterized protein n=1 Tax=Arundo donax TaxID=35708 RepID=A0A0A9DW11_ARUDO